MLTAERVHEIAKACFYTDAELPDRNVVPDGAVLVEGILHTYGFHPGRLEGYRVEIAAMLAELPLPFQPVPEGGGGGWTFLNACEDKDGRLWGQHFDMEMLFCLGIATGQAQWMMKTMVDVLPGGMPYVGVLRP